MKHTKKINYWYAVDETVVHIQATTPGQARRMLQQRYPAAILQRSSEKYFLLQKQNSHERTTHPF